MPAPTFTLTLVENDESTLHWRQQQILAVATLMASENRKYMEMLFNPVFSCPTKALEFQWFLEHAIHQQGPFFFITLGEGNKQQESPETTIGFVFVNALDDGSRVTHKSQTISLCMYVNSAYSGLGIGKGALAQMLKNIKRALPEVKQVEWHCYFSNIASMRVATANGFTFKSFAPSNTEILLTIYSLSLEDK